MNIAFTIDLEPDWGAPGGPCRALDDVLPDVLEWLDTQDIRATFFTVAEMAKRFPGPIRRIAERHEVASHGLSHNRLDQMDRDAAVEELRESRRVIEDATGKPVRGFRAPFLARHEQFSEDVQAAGYEYDSSGGACRPSLANAVLPKGAGPFEYPNGLTWLPISTMRDGLNPFCLTALRVGYPLSLAGLPGRPRVFFLHFHELSNLPVPRAAGGWFRRALLRQGQGAVAWTALKGMVRRYEERVARWTPCEELIAQARVSDREAVQNA